MTNWQEIMRGRCLQQWWDVSSEAGPSARGSSQFHEPPPTLDVLTVHNEQHTLQTFSLALVYIFEFHPGSFSVVLAYTLVFDDID